MCRIIEEILPFVRYTRLWRRFISESQGEMSAAEAYAKLSEEKLESLVKDERARGAAIDEKTFKLTLSVTFGLTVMGTISTILLAASEAPIVRLLAGLLLTLVVFYALAAGFVALGAMRTLPSYGLGVDPDLRDKPGARRLALAQALLRNEKIGLARHARNEAAYMALRNSFLSLFMLLAVYFALSAFPTAQKIYAWAKVDLDLAHYLLKPKPH